MNNYQFPFPTPWEVELNCSHICDGSFPGTNVSIKGTAQPNQLCSSDTVWLNISTEISVLPKMAPWGTRCALKTQPRMPTNLLSTRSIRTVLAWTVLLGKFKAWVQVQLTELTGHWTIKSPYQLGQKQRSVLWRSEEACWIGLVLWGHHRRDEHSCHQSNPNRVHWKRIDLQHPSRQKVTMLLTINW